MTKKASDAHLRANRKYTKESTKRVLLEIGLNTHPLVVESLDFLDSKQGYFISLAESDIHRANTHSITINGTVITSKNVMKYAYMIDELFPDICEKLNRPALERATSEFIPNTPNYIILGEYLHSSEIEDIVIEVNTDA